ncbi:MAG: propionate--CoA ligase [Aquabacterium sp.]|jgi:propionyl-CoA synthetase|uniref:propionate--CoA ligase n=1 Tax=Aquabacterium sp. TaxID=1872578 RepID=UPI001B57701F|nr:propionate--CoA ligase [Aquabacterium sp.]MBP7133326.1 propionate--CoA ligase [Aquabacterium sp.]MBP9063159.1 propionate--CoA ligase [Aquabacterium sp.]MDQ5926442.1 propionyl-CoA synthetase [Pseudomonadota bacterium]
MSYRALYKRSIHERDAYWAEQASRIHWHRPFDTVCDVSHPPFVKWFDGGLTNLCHNAVDRHVHDRADQAALVFVSTETNTEETISYGQLLVEVERMAAILHGLGVGKGDRVLIYMPMIPQAVIAMLATVRLGAIHSVVFGGFASHALASRIDDATPSVIVTADAGSRGGKVIPYKPLLDEAVRQSTHTVPHVLLVDRKLAPAEMDTPRDVDYWDARSSVMDAIVPCEWVEATHPSYTLYTSGTTGRPKGVQRDTGGYAVALAASMEQVYCGKPGETFFCASDIGWVVGHSYIVYGPLLTGMTTIIYEGLPIRPDAAIWWSLVEKYQVNVMFSAPTAIRVLKKQDPDCLKRHDLSSLKQLFLAGEPLDEPTAKWIGDAIGKPIIDNYWQTETGWPILSLARGVDPTLTPRLGSPGFPMPGYQVKLLDDQTGEELTGANQKGVLTIEGPLPPGCLQTIWGDDQRFVQTYWSTFPGKQVYNTFDWGIRDADGYYFILGRTDDVINVAGHRLGTREIEEAISSHAGVAEVAVVGVADPLKGQVAKAFVVPRDASRVVDDEGRKALEAEIMHTVDQQLGAVARPARVYFVNMLPKTRSGKMLRRAIQAVCEGRDTGDLSTIEDPTALQQLQEAAQR